MLTVVSAALVRDGRVLAARRREPRDRWEFPGGKVEPGETEAQALRRELREELGVEATVGRRLAIVDDGRIELRLWTATTATSADEPTAGADHAELRWVAPAEWITLDWLSLDEQLLGAIRRMLAGTPSA